MLKLSKWLERMVFVHNKSEKAVNGTVSCRVEIRPGRILEYPKNIIVSIHFINVNKSLY